MELKKTEIESSLAKISQKSLVGKIDYVILEKRRKDKMIHFWISFLLLGLCWLGLLYVSTLNSLTILLSVVFFAGYFILPLLKERLKQVVLSCLPIIVAFFSLRMNESIFIWLIYLVLLMISTSYFNGRSWYVYTGFLVVIMFGLTIETVHNEMMVFICLLVGISLVYVYHWKKEVENRAELKKQYESVFNEYRVMKRQITDSEELARQEERNQIAREIHDSVGHRLTALVMQMEVARMQARDEESKNKYVELKKLAQASLKDTREAVKALKSEEAIGLQAIIQLIRKLESESHLRVSIVLHSGVLGVVLSNPQSVTVYRAVQESLTNMMKHSGTRTAEVSFDWIAERDFRFQISHPIKQPVKIKEGFGLTNMRDRVTQLGGQLTIQQEQGKLSIIGQFPLARAKGGKERRYE
jgi:signal transduction histidine kinase